MRRYLPQRPGWSPGRWAYYRRFYRERIERVDGFINELLAELACSGFAPNTWVVFSTDHADLAGEHGRPFKGLSLYDASVRIPLIIAPPQIRMGGRNRVDLTTFADAPLPRTSDALTSHIDIVPTILELAGLPADPALPGRSLVPVLRGEPHTGPGQVFLESTDGADPGKAVRAVRSRGWKYLLGSGGEEELYDLSADPWETRNLAEAPEAASELVSLQRLLRDHLARERDPFLTRLAARNG